MKMNSTSCSYNSASRMKDLNISLEGELVESSPNSTSRNGIQDNRLGRDSASWKANSASRPEDFRSSSSSSRQSVPDQISSYFEVSYLPVAVGLLPDMLYAGMICICDSCRVRLLGLKGRSDTPDMSDRINSPIKMALIDNRITDRQDCILGAAKGNLAYQKFMFSVYPKFALDLKSANIDKTLSFIHHFERSDLMSPGDKPFTITYLIGYALTNSHHSIDYKKDEYIELDDVFSEIGHVKDKQFCDINPQENSWVLNIARNKKALGETLRPRISMDSLHIGESSERKDNNLIRNMSLKIDSLRQNIKQITDIINE
uniref:Uncharacterized protein n=34 Tax=Lactuca sativa TaxID=4236 RepID=A0A9R1UEW7_LACSA|nr:hypothetical protein LSAT_V11C900456960 [Lactuca sativa]